MLCCVNVCSEQPVTRHCESADSIATASRSAPYTSEVVSSTIATGELHTTVGNLPQTCNSRISSLPGSTATSLGIGLVVFEFVLIFAITCQHTLCSLISLVQLVEHQ